jgi:hypothetical protein
MEISVPAIISDELFAAVQQRREANKLQKGRQRKHEYSLGGMMECGHCHNNMSGVAKVDKGCVHRY